MQELVVGIRINGETGISFLGLAEVNEAIQQGRRIVSIEPGDVIVEKVGEEDGKVQLALGGGNFRVMVE